MDLQNGYKVIYENRTITNKVLTRHLKATKTVPATADVNLTYKDNSGTEISAATLASFKLVYENDGSLYGSTNGKVNKNSAEEITDTKILVYSGNDLLIGKVSNEPVAQVVAPKATQAKKKEAKSEEVIEN